MGSRLERWTGSTSHFAHVSNGLPRGDERTFLATLIAEATNLGLRAWPRSRDVAPHWALMRMQTWHMRKEMFGPALACLTNAIHAVRCRPGSATDRGHQPTVRRPN